MLLKRFEDKEVIDSYLSRGELYLDWTTVYLGFLRYVYVWISLKTQNFNSSKYLKI